MKNKERELIQELMLERINEDDFLLAFPSIPKDKSTYVLNLLESAFAQKEADAVEFALLFGIHFKLFSHDFIKILCDLLLEKWHYMHEDIILILQDLKSPQSVDALYKATLMKFEYLNYDTTYALTRKCIHALGDINTSDSVEKLKLLAQSNIPIIREKAEKQLYYYKR